MRLPKTIPALTLLTCLTLTILLLHSCTKDQANNAGISDAESRIKKVSFDSSYVSFGFNYINYNDEKLVNIGDLDISYPTQNQVKVVYQKNTNQYSLFSYDDSNKLAKVEFTTPYFGQWHVNTFTLHTSNNKVDSVTSGVTGISPIWTLWKFKYDGNGNIVQVLEQYTSSFQVDTINFRYDNRPNLFQKNQLFFLIDFSFWGNDLGNKAIPYLFSKNNVVYEKSSRYWNSLIYNYKSDIHGRITELFYEPYEGVGWKYFY